MQKTITQPPRQSWLALLCLTALALIGGQPAFSAPPTHRLLATNPAQERLITGQVLSVDDNSALPGVSVTVKGSSRGTTTDANGAYKIAVPNGQAILVFSSVGFRGEELPVGNKSTIDVRMTSDDKTLNEVVVVGYGTLKKSQLTGAISSVTPKQITEQPIANLGQALQGRVAGVDVAMPGSQPGSVPTILIRGRRSFNAGNQPLYVVDGIPLSAGYEDFNPNDVASMEVLKDATSTAIYGARGANGVIIITTKRGAPKGKTVISYDAYTGVSDALDKVHLLTGPEYAELKRESRRAIGTYNDVNGNPVPTGVTDAYADSKLFEAVELDGIAKNRTTDYQSMVLRQGIQNSQSLGVQGGNDRTQFYISGNYFKDKGILPGQDFTRMSLRFNLDHQINKFLKVGISSYSMYSITNGKNRTAIFGNTLAQNPLAKAFDDNGNLIFSPTSDALLTNPLSDLVPGAQIDETKKYRIFNSIYAEVNILSGLKYRVNFGPDFTITRAGRFIGSLTNDNKGANATASDSARFSFNYTLENILTYNKTFGNHNLGVTALQSIQRDNSEALGVGVNGVAVESQSFYNLGNASSVLGVRSSLTQWTINSFMARINYDYKDKYLVTATIRRDGSSRFGTNTKYGNFPGIALAWNISNESFLKGTTWLDQLKIRASYGSTGNQGVSPYQTQGLLTQTQYAWNNTSAFGYRPNTIGNPDLHWESSLTKNIGFDFSFFRGRLAGALELYQTNTTDLLLSDQLPTSTGFSAVTRNVGETRNRGIELSLSSVNVTTKGGFTWRTDVVFYKNREAILSLYNGAVDDPGNKWFIGQPLYTFFDYKKAGIWQTSEADAAKAAGFTVGQIKVQDTNGDGKITADDRVILGNDIPTWTGSLTNRFSYKGFDLSFLVYARIGQMIQSGFHLNNLTLQGRYNQIKVNYWTPLNPTNDYPRPNFNQEFPAYNSTLTYFDGSFVKVRNINFGYTFPSSLVQKLKLQSLRVFCSIQQPFIFSSYRSKYNGIDPETPSPQLSNGITPAVRLTTFGLNVKF